jgi:chromosome segregation ATPase
MSLRNSAVSFEMSLQNSVLISISTVSATEFCSEGAAEVTTTTEPKPKKQAWCRARLSESIAQATLQRSTLEAELIRCDEAYQRSIRKNDLDEAATSKRKVDGIRIDMEILEDRLATLEALWPTIVVDEAKARLPLRTREYHSLLREYRERGPAAEAAFFEAVSQLEQVRRLEAELKRKRSEIGELAAEANASRPELEEIPAPFDHERLINSKNRWTQACSNGV